MPHKLWFALIAAAAAITAQTSVAPPTASAAGPVVTVAEWYAPGQRVNAEVGHGPIEDLVKQTLPNEWFPSDPPDALRAGASIIRQDYYHFWMHPDTSQPFCTGVTPYVYQVRSSRLQGFTPGTGQFSTARATDETVMKGWAPYGSASADGVYLSFLPDLQIDTAVLSYSYTWKPTVSSAVYPPGEYAPGGHGPGGSEGVVLPFGSACLYDCTLDYDGDGRVNFYDNCPFAPNASQLYVHNEIDNGPGVATVDRTVPRSDEWGDACSTDRDNDGLRDSEDTEPLGSAGVCGAFAGHSDGHAHPAGDDITDADGNGPSWDTDNDSVRDGAECFLGTDPRNQASRPTSLQCANLPTGGVGPNTSTTDADNDGLWASAENCKWGTGDALADSDGDGLRDCVEANDIDGNGAQNFPGDTIASAKATNNLIGKTLDFDLNGDGAVNFPGDTILSAKIALHIGGRCL